MKIIAKVKAHSKEERVEKTGKGEFNIWVKAPATEGRANEAVREALSGYFGVAKSRVEILKGHTSKNKVIEII